MIAQKNTQNAVMRKKGAQLLPLSCLLASLPVLAAEQADKELPKAAETMVVTGTAMKVEVPMAETPRAVSVVNREELDQHAVLKLDESLRYRSGVLSQSSGSDTDADWFKVRGFDAARLDGSEGRAIDVPRRGRDPLRLDGQSYLLHYLLPNLFFHCTTTYAILREAGVALGKDDFMGAS